MRGLASKFNNFLGYIYPLRGLAQEGEATYEKAGTKNNGPILYYCEILGREI
jgi:hypothetical protein